MASLQELQERAGNDDPTLAAYIESLSYDEILQIAQEHQSNRTQQQRENQLYFYKPVSEKARAFHYSKAPIKCAFGGNGSSKSETQLVDILIEMTGIIPLSLPDYPKEKLRPPINARLVVKDFTNTWEGAIRSKLIWDKWTGLADGIRGHWGWVPKNLLINGKWEDSWSEKYRTLTLTNGSTLQIMAHEQDVLSHAGASKHRIGVDEGPKYKMWREECLRLREGGSISLAMTPPDDESESWDAAWTYDELYIKGMDGPDKDPDIDSFVFDSYDNPFTDHKNIEIMTKGMTEAQRQTRLRGQFMHLGGLVYPVYTDATRFWCFKCNDKTLTVEGVCGKCSSTDLCEYSNWISPDSRWYNYPTVFLLDPHPRKPNMMIWVSVSPVDDACQIHEMEIDKEPEDAAKLIFQFEKDLRLDIKARVMDAKMRGQVGSHGARGTTVGDMWDQVGIRCKGADNDFAVGKNRLTALLKPDRRTKLPRYVVFNTCKKTNYMFKRFSWDDYKNMEGREQKQAPKTLNDDFPALARYFANMDVSYRGLLMGNSIQHVTRKRRSQAYG